MYVPKVYWDITSRRVLSCEWIEGVPMTDLNYIDKQNWSRKSIMETVVDVFSDVSWRVAAGLLCNIIFILSVTNSKFSGKDSFMATHIQETS